MSMRKLLATGILIPILISIEGKASILEGRKEKHRG
jgi:hypothetical protein